MTRVVIPQRVFENYDPTPDDIRRLIEKRGQPASLTKMQEELMGVAHEHGCMFVSWPSLKKLVLEMKGRGELIALRQPQGYYRYRLP